MVNKAYVCLSGTFENIDTKNEVYMTIEFEMAWLGMHKIEIFYDQRGR